MEKKTRTSRFEQQRISVNIIKYKSQNVNYDTKKIVQKNMIVKPLKYNAFKINILKNYEFCIVYYFLLKYQYYNVIRQIKELSYREKQEKKQCNFQFKFQYFSKNCFIIIIQYHNMNKIQNATKYARLQLLQNQLQSHNIYSSINDIPKLRIFMESHVFAVWDFMCLVKSLQRRLTCVQPIWIPVSSPNTARFMNEIVLGEETDLHPDGKNHISHFELYVNAMDQIGADTKVIREFVENSIAGKSPQKSLQNKHIPKHVRDFVLNTLSSLNQPTSYLAGWFFYGRQEPIPLMFQSFLKNLPEDKKCDQFKYYLDRHIQIDGNDHGPMAAKIIAQLAQKEDLEYKMITEGAINAIEHRTKLWDGVYQSL